MKILIISPYFPPDHGGVSDYTRILINQLGSDRHHVQLLTAQSEPLIDVSVHIVKNWNNRNFLLKLKSINLDLFDFVLVQYTPLSFGQKSYGINFGLIKIFSYIKSKSKLYMMSHEANYPFEFTLKGFVIGIPNIIQFYFYLFYLDHIFFSTQKNVNYWSNLNKKCISKISLLPIYSNIPVLDNNNKLRKISAKFKLDDEYKYLIYFGGAHYSIQFHFFIEALKHLKNHKIKILIVGTNRDSWPSIPKNQVLDNIIFFGKSSEDEVSYLYQKSHAVLLPYLEGVTTRRGTLMSAMIHSKPIVTTFGHCTNDKIPWSKITAISDINDISEFVKNIEKILNNLEYTNELVKQSSGYYKENFSKEVICKKLIDYCRKSNI